MKIAFTVCSNNYFAQAKILINSFFNYNSDYKFIIGLVDRQVNELNYSIDERVEVITIDQLRIDPKYNIFTRYNIVELNTSVKASYFKKIFQLYPQTTLLIYFDPDIAIFNKISEIEDASLKYSILLTPHILTPIKLDEFIPSENTFLNYGLYNLGFIALSFWDKQVHMFLDWWEERTLTMCYNKPWKGIFVDQLWINFTPIYFKNVKIFNNPGLNMAPWNLHERNLSIDSAGTYKVNQTCDLIFYHFSSYNFNEVDTISYNTYTRYTFDNHPDLIILYSWYHKQLVENDIDSFSKIKCFYLNTEIDLVSKENNYIKLKEALKQWIPPLFWNIIKKLRTYKYNF